MRNYRFCYLYCTLLMYRGAGEHTEPCSGTHLLNTMDIGHFVILSLRTTGPGLRSVRAVTGEAAVRARLRAEQLEDKLRTLEAEMRTAGDMRGLLEKVHDLERSLSSQDVPYLALTIAASQIRNLKQLLKTSLRSNAKEAGMEAVKMAIQEQEDAASFCHYLNLSSADKFNLTSALKLVSREKPSLLLVNMGKEIKGKAVVPEELVRRGLSAKDWLDIVAEVVGGRVSAPRGQHQDSNCNLIGGKPQGEDTEIMKLILSRVTEYARTVIK